MIPIILSPKYSRRGHGNTTDAQQAVRVPNDPYNSQPTLNNHYSAANQYNHSSSTTNLNKPPADPYNQPQYTTHYATTRRKYYTKQDVENKNKEQQQTNNTTLSQSNLNNQKSSDGGFLSTLGGTLRRKKKAQADEVTELTAEQVENEGKEAIDSNNKPRVLTSDYGLSENESTTVLDESCRNQPDFQDLVRVLVNWINDELKEQRIIVENLEIDLYDGQVLGRLVEKLMGSKLDVVEITQNEDAQKQKIGQVFDVLNRVLSQKARWAQVKWSVEGVHSRNIIQIIHLLVTMIRFFRPPVRLPENVTVRVNVIMKQSANGSEPRLAVTSTMEEKLTEQYDELGMKVEQTDAFDALFDRASNEPEKLAAVKRYLREFVNKRLNKINMECFSVHPSGDLDPEDFSDGLLLIFLMASLENYFVPLGNLFTQPTDPIADMTPNGVQTALQYENYINTSPIHKLHNVNIAFQLMEDADINVKGLIRAEDIVNADLKSTMRVLHMIYSKYKHL